MLANTSIHHINWVTFFRVIITGCMSWPFGVFWVFFFPPQHLLKCAIWSALAERSLALLSLGIACTSVIKLRFGVHTLGAPLCLHLSLSGSDIQWHSFSYHRRSSWIYSTRIVPGYYTIPSTPPHPPPTVFRFIISFREASSDSCKVFRYHFQFKASCKFSGPWNSELTPTTMLPPPCFKAGMRDCFSPIQTWDQG